MNEQEQYETIDLPFYRAVLAPKLPAEVLDFHTHVWRREHWLDENAKTASSSADVGVAREGGRYMATTLQYDADDLTREGERMFPGRRYRAVCFGQPTPAANIEATNAYAAESGRRDGVYPLLITGRDMMPPDELQRQIIDGGFFGYKVYLGWLGTDYGNISIEDMIGPAEMELANRLRLVVLIHVPRAGRLVDPEVQRGVADLSRCYPEASIVLAHCGRCFTPTEMLRAIGSIRGLDNVYLDTSMVMDPTVLRIVFENIESGRVLFGTDHPVAAMRGRRVYVMDHWVDLVLEGYPESAYRVASNAMKATFMTYEIAASIIVAAEAAGLGERDICRIFFQNGMDLLRRRRL